MKEEDFEKYFKKLLGEFEHYTSERESGFPAIQTTQRIREILKEIYDEGYNKGYEDGEINIYEAISEGGVQWEWKKKNQSQQKKWKKNVE